VSSKGGDSSLVHGGLRMDKLKVACKFAKVEIVRYVSNMCTVRLQLDLSYNLVG
jgi:hypothetical protein